MSSKELRLQLNFKNPLLISSFDVRLYFHFLILSKIMDTLRIEIIDSSFFLTEQQNKTYAPIARNYTMRKILI
jgi:hypothetical protein